MNAELFARSTTTASVLATLDEKINHIAKEAGLNKARQVEYEAQLQTNLKEILERKEKQNALSRRAQGDNVPMDIDEPPPIEFMKNKNRKCVITLHLLPLFSCSLNHQGPLRKPIRNLGRGTNSNCHLRRILPLQFTLHAPPTATMYHKLPPFADCIHSTAMAFTFRHQFNVGGRLTPYNIIYAMRC